MENITECAQFLFSFYILLAQHLLQWHGHILPPKGDRQVRKVPTIATDGHQGKARLRRMWTNCIAKKHEASCTAGRICCNCCLSS